MDKIKAKHMLVESHTTSLVPLFHKAWSKHSTQKKWQSLRREQLWNKLGPLIALIIVFA